MRQLEAGQELTVGPWTMDAATVEAYLDAVSDDTSPYRESGLAPPMAVAGRTLGALVESLSMPPGSVHVGQELEFLGAVKVGQELACSMRLARQSKRGGWIILVLEFSAQAEGEVVLRGKTTVMLPLEEVSG